MTIPVPPYNPPGIFDQANSVPTTATLQNAAITTGNGTDYDITGMATVQLLVNPTSLTAGTVTFWASIDGTTFNKILGNQMDTTTVADNVANPGSTTSIWTFETAGLTKIRAVLTGTVTSGTPVTITGAASPLPSSVPLGVTLSSAVLAAGTALVGTIQISDGTTSSQKLAVDSSGNASINIGKYAGAVPVLAGADGNTAANVPLGAQGLSNGTTIDQARGNQDNISLLASASRTTTQTVADQTNYNARGVIVVLDMTVASASPSVTLEIDAKDPVSGKYYSLLTGAAVTSVSTNVYTVYPGAPATTNVSANSPLPRTWRVKVTANNANAGTYSCGASLIV